jgi:uncharacterized Zn-finger protein
VRTCVTRLENQHLTCFLDTRTPFARSDSLSSISSSAAATNAVGGEGIIRRCEVCDRTFDRPSNYVVHMRTHTGEQPFACSHDGCEKKFSIRSNLNRHLRAVHQDVATDAGSEVMDVDEGVEE